MQRNHVLNGYGIKHSQNNKNSFLLTDNVYYHDHEQELYHYFNKNFFFTYIRDPVDRSLSSYYEIAVHDTKIFHQALDKDENETDEDSQKHKNVK